MELTQWINQHPDDAKWIMNAEIKQETHSSLADDVLSEAWSRIDVTYDPLRSSLLAAAQQAFKLSLLGHEQPDLSGLYDLSGGMKQRVALARSRPFARRDRKGDRGRVQP